MYSDRRYLRHFFAPFRVAFNILQRAQSRERFVHGRIVVLVPGKSIMS